MKVFRRQGAGLRNRKWPSLTVKAQAAKCPKLILNTVSVSPILNDLRGSGEQGSTEDANNGVFFCSRTVKDQLEDGSKKPASRGGPQPISCRTISALSNFTLVTLTSGKVVLFVRGQASSCYKLPTSAQPRSLWLLHTVTLPQT